MARRRKGRRSIYRSFKARKSIRRLPLKTRLNVYRAVATVLRRKMSLSNKARAYSKRYRNYEAGKRRRKTRIANQRRRLNT